MAFTTAMLSLFAGASAHVSMVYLDGQPGSIRNANSATGNGGASVNTPCGGATTFGSNGVGLAQDGDTVQLSMRYAAGHNGAFRMAFACGAGDGSALEADAVALTAADNACTVTGAASAYGAGDGGGATAVGQDAMTITCTLPEQNNAENIDCMIGVLDQRDWGGCVDISLASAAAALPPSPPPAPFVSSAGPYYFSTRGMVDTSAGVVAGVGTFSCCGLSSGSLTVPDYTGGADGTTVVATFSSDAQAEECPATVPDKTVAPPANSATETLSVSITLTTSENGNKLTGETTMANQPFEVIISSGELSFTNLGGDQPIICDGAFSANADGGSSGVGSGDDDDSFSGWGKAAVGVVVVLVVIIAVLGYKKFAGGGKRSPPQLTATQMAPPPPPNSPPPPTVGPGLPPGWIAAVDLASGHTYYVNQATGASTWTNPSNGV